MRTNIVREGRFIIRSSRAVLLGFGVTLVGCASAGPSLPPSVQSGPSAEMSIDGLHLVDNSVITLAYVRPDLDLSQYTRFMLDPVTVAYQKDPQGRTRTGSGGASNFALSTSQMENLKEMFQEAVVEEMGQDDGYPLATAAAPNVLRVTAHLTDLLVRVPTDVSGRSRVAAASYGEVTLVVELRDSQTGQILARVGDRRDPTRGGGRNLTEVSPTFMRADVQRMFSDWASLMRERLDEVRELGIG